MRLSHQSGTVPVTQLSDRTNRQSVPRGTSTSRAAASAHSRLQPSGTPGSVCLSGTHTPGLPREGSCHVPLPLSLTVPVLLLMPRCDPRRFPATSPPPSPKAPVPLLPPLLPSSPPSTAPAAAAFGAVPAVPIPTRTSSAGAAFTASSAPLSVVPDCIHPLPPPSLTLQPLMPRYGPDCPHPPYHRCRCSSNLHDRHNKKSSLTQQSGIRPTSAAKSPSRILSSFYIGIRTGSFQYRSDPKPSTLCVIQRCAYRSARVRFGVPLVCVRTLHHGVSSLGASAPIQRNWPGNWGLSGRCEVSKVRRNQREPRRYCSCYRRLKMSEDAGVGQLEGCWTTVMAIGRGK